MRIYQADGFAIGRFIEKIDRFLRIQENKNHDCTKKNDRPKSDQG